MRRVAAILLVAAWCVAARGAPAPGPSDEPRGVIGLGTTVEEGRKMLVATVKADRRPLPDARVAFFVQRSFGELALGEETTLDDGTAAVPFPDGLPGDARGNLEVIARLKAPANLASTTGRATLGGGVVVATPSDPFPRAVWAPRAPLVLILVFVVLLGGVWLTFAYVLIQLARIRIQAGGHS